MTTTYGSGSRSIRSASLRWPAMDGKTSTDTETMIRLVPQTVAVLVGRTLERIAIEQVCFAIGIRRVRLVDAEPSPTRGCGDVRRGEMLILRGGGGIDVPDACARAKGNHARVLAMCDDGLELVRMIHAGADGALLMSATPDDLAAALQDVLVGKRAFPADVFLDYAEHDRRAKSFDPVTMGVLEGLGAGLTDRALVERLHVTHDVLRSIIHRLLRELGVEQRWQAVIAAQNLGLL